MWSLLKAEISYNKIFLIIAYSIAVPTLIFSFIWGGGLYQKGNFPSPIIVLFHQMMFITVLFPIILGVTIDRRNSRRTRFHVLLIHPGSIESSLIWQTLSITGWMFVLASGPLFYNINHCFKDRTVKLVLNLLCPVLFMALVILYFEAIIPQIGSFSLSNIPILRFSSLPLGSLLFFFVGRRKSYVE